MCTHGQAGYIPRLSWICLPAGLSAGRSPDHLRAEIALDALEMAVFVRRDEDLGGLVHHSDRGVQYTAIRYAERLAGEGAVRSVGSKGDSYDNAAAEALNSLYKRELIDPKNDWEDVDDVMLATMDWVQWYNEERIHSYSGDIPPKKYEEAYYQALDSGKLASSSQTSRPPDFPGRTTGPLRRSSSDCRMPSGLLSYGITLSANAALTRSSV